ncbi:hypothetical protein OB905_12030 [Halobacteria archaeon AArc-dxtr1]|nr:hypothetical protein [Halobacteria archaeon AArc-dxtr1]
MSTESEETTTYGIDSRIGWPVGGAVGGALGALAMGLVLWLADPDIIESAIPTFYGFDPGATGWAIHAGHGVVLGAIFGFLITRESILGIVRTNPETEALSQTGLAARIIGSGVAYGLAVWAVLPVILLPTVSDALGTGDGGGFPTLAVESLVGHLLFGLILGLVFALTVDTEDRSPDSPLED